ncbi:hypothetical protein [Aegicerativicinus sediminis]|uniref:hypothetical protein n=1 Tax=Aegicerativicinus sediminis TaxID=2893202 RepID=UPI001E4D82DB|nr:hypothetical protein [Aegicerativicinus sediminis]
MVSLGQAKQNNKELRELREELNIETEEGAAALDAINAKLDVNTEFIKENVSSLEQQKINIGNYKDSIKEAFDEMDLFNGGFLQFITRSKEAGGVTPLVTNNVKSLTTSVVGLTKSALAFIATPIGALLAVLVGAFLLVRNAMNRSEEATNKITKVFSVFGGMVNKLLDWLEPLGEFLIDGIVLGFELAAKAAEDAINIISSGLELLGFDGAAKSVKEFYGEFKEGAKLAMDLANAEAELEKNQRQARLTQLEYQRDAEKLRQIRDNENLSIKERIEANNQLGAVLKEQLNEELKIAEQALLVANLRIQAEGETKEALDAQAEALTNIADIQERITSQESEQLTNRVALQKEAADKAKEIADKAIAQQKAELDLFIQQQGVKAQNLRDQLKVEEEIYKRETEILEKELANRNLTQTEYDAELLWLKNEFLQKQGEVVTAEAERELEQYIQNHQSKIDADLFFSEESLRVEQERLNGIAEAQREFERTRLEQGIISQEEFNAAINQINEDNRIALDEAQKERDEAQKEKEAIDLENKRAAAQANFENEFAKRAEELEFQRQQEVAAAEQTGADIGAINEKYAAFKKQLSKEVEDFRIAQNQRTFEAISGLLGQESALGKIVALAAIINDTIQKSTEAFNIASVLASNPFTAALAPNAYLQAGLIIAKGAAQAAKLVVPKLARGGAFKIGGRRHSQGGTKFYGEDGTAFEAEKDETMLVLNRKASEALTPLLSNLNQKHGGVALSTPSSYLAAGGQVIRGNSPAPMPEMDYDRIMEAVRDGSYQGSQEGSMRGSSAGTYSGIVDREVNEEIARGANF